MSGRLLNLQRIAAGDPRYPANLAERLGPGAAPTLTLCGPPELLRQPLLALFCSIQVPAELVLPAYDLARELRDAGTPVIGGFQSPVEREMGDFLLRGRQPVVICPARGLEDLHPRASWRAALEEGRLLLVSGFFARQRRPTAALSAARNRLVAALAERLLVIHAAPGGRVQRVVTEALDRGQPVSCFAHPGNRDLELRGVQAVRPPDPPPYVPAPGSA